jgi:hypothetical protein
MFEWAALWLYDDFITGDSLTWLCGCMSGVIMCDCHLPVCLTPMFFSQLSFLKGKV